MKSFSTDIAIPNIRFYSPTKESDLNSCHLEKEVTTNSFETHNDDIGISNNHYCFKLCIIIVSFNRDMINTQMLCDLTFQNILILRGLMMTVIAIMVANSSF